MTLVGKQDILAAIDWDFDEFEVPKWGTVRIRALTAGERLELVKQFGGGNLTNEDAFAFFTRLIAMSLVDAAGSQLFDAANADDVAALQTRNWSRLQFVADRIMAFNGMGGEAAKELEKN
jgi:hypothetical protein